VSGADLATQKTLAAVTAAASGSGAVLATVKGWVLELFGVPLPVFLAAAAGAFGARVFLPEAPFWRALALSTFWTLAAGWLAELVRWGLARWLAGEAEMPTGALAGIALIVAAMGPRLAPVVMDKGTAAVGRWLDSIRSAKQGGGDA
jgi:hypothetical protein